MRINTVMREFNLSLEVICNFLLSKGIEINHNPNQKINQEQYNLIEFRFSEEKLKREALNKIIIKDHNYELGDMYTKVKTEAHERYRLFCEKRKKLREDIKLLKKKEQRYWALNDEEIETLLNRKKQQIEELLLEVQDIIDNFRSNNLYEEKEENDSTISNEENEVDSSEYIEENKSTINKTGKYKGRNEWGSYRSKHENPWVDVFGPGDEAETAYWNTQ